MLHLGNLDRASWWMEDAREGTAVREVRSALPFSLAFWYCLHRDSSSCHWERSYVGQLGLVLEPVLVPGFVVPHCMLKDHNFEHLLSVIVGEFTLIDEGGNVSV